MTTTTSKPNVLTIDPSDLEELESKIAKLNRKAVKLGLEPVGHSTAERIVKIPVLDSHDSFTGQFREVAVIDVTLVGTAPRINGWTLVCKVEHTESGQLVTQPAGCNEDLSAWYDCSGRECDHCHTNRDRKDTFVLRDESGKTIRIGRSCLADYVRSEDALAVAAACLWGDFFPPHDDERCGFGMSYCYSVLQMVSFACAAIRVDGGYKKGAEGTRNRVSFAINRPPVELSLIEDWKSLQPTAADVERAALVIEWCKNQSGSDYVHNLNAACHMLTATLSTQNLLISAPSAYAHAIGDEATGSTKQLAKIEPKSGRYAVTGTVKTLRSQDSEWGTTLKMLIVIVEENGTWNGWCTVPDSLLNTPRVVEGDAVSLTATVEPKEPGFAILKRPAKASKVSKAA